MLANLVNHKLRTAVDAIAVGYHTALNDNPALTPRLWHGKNPVRVVFDRTGSLPNTLKLFTDGGETLVFTEAAETTYASQEQVKLVQYTPGNEIQTALDYLYQVGIAHLLVEGGTKLIEKFMKANVVDSVRTYTNKDLHLKKGIKAPTFGLSTLKEYELNETTLRIFSTPAN